MIWKWLRRTYSRLRLRYYRAMLPGARSHNRLLDNFGISIVDVKAHMRMLTEYSEVSVAYEAAQRRYNAIPRLLRWHWLFPKRIATYEQLRARWNALFAVSVMTIAEERAKELEAESNE